MNRIFPSSSLIRRMFAIHCQGLENTPETTGGYVFPGAERLFFRVGGKRDCLKILYHGP
jgi:hypothetical protein